MSDIRQSPEYAKFIKSLGWQVEKLGKNYIFIRKFPLIGSLIKIQRTDSLDFRIAEKLIKKHRAFQITLEPSRLNPGYQPLITNYKFRPLKSPFIPTKTLIKNISGKEEEILNSFSKNKRRDIRIAQKNNIIIKEGAFKDFVKLKKHYLWQKHLLPIAAGYQIKLLCRAFGPKAKILIAYYQNCPVAGTLLLFSSKTAYYWQAAATKEGKKNLAPTLLVWEAIRLAKKQDCWFFDFEGVADPRFSEQNSWQGFTRFKEGFRGKEIVYPQPITKAFLNLPFFK